MKKRFLCLALCVFMLLPLALCGCSDTASKTEDTSTSTTNTKSAKAMTITLYTITDKSTTEEALHVVEDAMNLITEAEFNTHIILRATTADKYDKLVADSVAAIEEQLAAAAAEAAAKKEAEKAAREAAKANGGATTTAAETKAEEVTEEADETMINEYGFEETIYPKEEGTQLDIFLINSLEMFNKYQAAGYLAALDEELSIGSKILKQYIHPNFLAGAKVGTKTYAIPNNHVFGEYEYLLVNKEIFDGLYYDIDNVSSFTDLADYFTDVIKYNKDVIPLCGEYDGGVYYLDGRKSVIGAIIPTDLSSAVQATPKNLLTDGKYMAYFNLMNQLEEVNGIKADGKLDDGNTYAAAVIKGDYNTPAQYEDKYYVVPLKYPTADNEDIYSCMYAVSTFTKDLSRCMEIVTYLTTNEEFINLFTYGVEGVHYTKDELTDVVHKIGKDYSMNMLHTGNQFLMYQSADMSEAMKALSDDNWALAKLQNLDMVTSPYLGFTLATEITDKKAGTTEKIKLGEEGGTQYTIKQVLDKGAGIIDEYLDRIKNFEPYTYIEMKYKTVIKNGVKQKIENPVEKEWTLSDEMGTINTELSEIEELIVGLDAANANSLAGQYDTWFAAKAK